MGVTSARVPIYQPTPMNPTSPDPVAVAQQFWRAAAILSPGSETSFPRRLEIAIPAALPLAIVCLRSLTVMAIAEWLCGTGVEVREFGGDRPLRGCLVAFGGHGIVFVDENDDSSEIQLTLAHEAAHFLCHYTALRDHAVARLGPEILEVLDGIRPPRNEERLAGVLRGCPIGQYRHMMNRDHEGSVLSLHVERTETDADLVALELLAPAEMVARICRQQKGRLDDTIALDLLQREFQIPAWGAKLQVQVIVRRHGDRKSAWLAGLSRSARDAAGM
jgi:hypothetical protein